MREAVKTKPILLAAYIFPAIVLTLPFLASSKAAATELSLAEVRTSLRGQKREPSIESLLELGSAKHSLGNDIRNIAKITEASIALLETETRRHSLENKSGGALSMAGLPLGNITTHRQLEAEVSDLLKLGNLRANMSKEAFDATPFGNSVKKIMDLIENSMMPQVLETHTANQNELLELSAQVTTCGKVKNTQVAKAGKKKRLYLKLSPMHRTCRAGEAGLSAERTECHEEQGDKKKLMDLRCSAFAMVDKQTGDQTANRAIMVKGGSESTESYVNRITATVCGTCQGEEACKDCKDSACGMKRLFYKAKIACETAKEDYEKQVKKCKTADKLYFHKKASCNSLQDQMDGASCKRAVETKDACEAYSECFFDKKSAYESLEAMVKQEEKDRQAEWRGLKRMQCIIKAFGGGKVTNDEVTACQKKLHSTAHLVIKYAKLPKLATCHVPLDYPNTPLYKKVNFAPLPALAKGRQDSYQCTGLQEISTEPAANSPKTCKCSRVTLNGPFSPGPLVRCTNCLDVRRSEEKSSCPEGTKLFSPQSRTDWKTFFASAAPLRAPNWIIDITRPDNSCGGCTKNAMNSENPRQSGWQTSDRSPWWLRSTKFKEPSGDYHANCYMDLWPNPKRNENHITFNDKTCNYHSKSYYCQPKKVSLTPKEGSPNGCVCKLVTLSGIYSAGSLLRCEGCLRVSRSLQKNSCPVGTKIFSPASKADWATFLHSATPLRSPHFIVDITQAQDGCGGCSKHAMTSRNPAQATWRTSDGSPWWLRSTKYSEPNGQYHANCYMNLGTIANQNSVTFSDNTGAKCQFNSDAYFCQTAKIKLKPRPPAPPPPPAGPPQPEKGGSYNGYKCAKGLYTGITKECDHFTNMTEVQCKAKCKNSTSAMDKKSCDKVTGIPNCVAFTYSKRSKMCMLYRACTSLVKWKGHPDIITKLSPTYNPQARTFKRFKGTRCNGKPYTQPGGVPKGPKGITAHQCWDYCYGNKWVGNKDVPVKRCVAMAFYANDGYCDLYDKCETTVAVGGVLTLKKTQKFQGNATTGAANKEPPSESSQNQED